MSHQPRVFGTTYNTTWVLAGKVRTWERADTQCRSSLMSCLLGCLAFFLLGTDDQMETPILEWLVHTVQMAVSHLACDVSDLYSRKTNTGVLGLNASFERNRSQQQQLSPFAFSNFHVLSILVRSVCMIRDAHSIVCYLYQQQTYWGFHEAFLPSTMRDLSGTSTRVACKGDVNVSPVSARSTNSGLMICYHP